MSRHARTAPSPRAHWLLLATATVSAVLLLALHAIVTAGAATGPLSWQTGDSTGVPRQVLAGGAVVDARPDPAVASRPRDRTLAITFEDGPDPVWTPAVLDVLDRFGARATFFVTGAGAARHPGLVREIAERGHELGSHTATHTDLRAAGELRTALELRATDLALAGAAGVNAPLVRPPGPVTPAELDDAGWRVAERIAAQGRLTVLSDVDSGDGGHPGTDRIVAGSLPADRRGAVLRMHDGGGDRSQTVAALERLLPSLRADGWRLTTVSDSVGVVHATTEADARLVVGGWLLVFAVQAAESFAAALDTVLVIICVLAGARLLLALAALRRRPERPPRACRDPVTVVVPAHNERDGIEATLRSILSSDHPVEVVVVDDGSVDGTAGFVERLGLRRVRVIRQVRSGRAAALNTGLSAARTEIVVAVDADTTLGRRAVGRLARHFADPRVAAVSGNTAVTDRTGVLGGWQHIEYVAGLGLDRRLSTVLGCLPAPPGAVRAFRRSAVRRLGGVPTDTLAEDADLAMALERAGSRVVHDPSARAWTAVPGTLGGLWRQRYRWSYGSLQAGWKHRSAVRGTGAEGRLGRRGLPYRVVFGLVLPLLAPLADLAVVSGLLAGEGGRAVPLWLAFQVLQAAPAVVAFRLAGEPLRPLLALPVQQFAYRQLLWLAVVQSLLTALAGVRMPWHRVRRRTGVATSHGR
ncbi:cellulose synthase/poly-beta-1,6-N-acetylglucosamine synthase-like glycosyltransferase [Prauserella shujinwangii]|uniref:Cellulose synthase/poly-beta-1,6-N-acetylglucosamine synthase-like glycosyltransferase n=1 Tax=Prauserella shujinwangii TaxID=1453103 RepID=A0A2T0LPV5_9PSEU|nr:bifunctional polysaccharide deacetylase/glycosyltransferase family 2 protein [Prauserella shujinwangii]PRX45361.1 cellulose synthase/poly-beta-1,6-N-acetylglucosamine synthase-like glycosyltransferase [Prauserella shujinwangii]